MAFDISLVIKRRGPTLPYKVVYQRGANRFRAFWAAQCRMAASATSFAFSIFFEILLIKAVKSSYPPIQNETWGYVEVRNGAFMFWWLYGAEVEDTMARQDKPLVMWLQGGPGASSTGYGNFEEIGPLDVNLKPRNTTWIKEANVLFVDNPVGCGYSYVLDQKALTTNISGKGTGAMTWPTNFYSFMLILLTSQPHTLE